MSNYEGECPRVVVWEEPEQRYSIVLDRTGNPFMVEQRKEPAGFKLGKAADGKT